MLVGITGTPGTGKTSVTDILEKNPKYQILHLTELINKYHLYSEFDDARDCVVANMDRVQEQVNQLIDVSKFVTIIDSHLSHYIADVVIVLRLEPDILKNRLLIRNYSDAKVEENLEAEALDIILFEAVEWCEKVFEINTTGKSIEEVVLETSTIIDAFIKNDCDKLLNIYRPGAVDWSNDYFHEV